MVIEMSLRENRKLIDQAWYNFFVLKKDEIAGVRELIKESWYRSREYGIDYENQYMYEDDRQQQKLSINENLVFIDIARSYMDDLYKIISNTNFMITLLDREGFVIDSLVHPTLDESSEFKLINLKESRIGTNAMGTCLYLDRPVQTYGEEHCYRVLHKFTTSAAPIHNSKGNIIGCIGITGFANDISVHTLGMATAAAYAIENKIKLSQNKKNNLIIEYSNEKLYSFQDIIGDSHIIKEAINIAKIGSQGNSNVLILGESGTGKELFAQAIHNNSSRRNQPFIDVNCGALPLSLAESELFGYEGGAYTGSKKEGQPGKFELANGGTIFLDEIGELPLSIQAALLRVIQERKVVRVGGIHSREIDIMIIAATNKNLFEAVSNNTFRGDLFYRLNVFTINLPSLREHKEDIPKLSYEFIRRYNKIFNRNIKGLSDETLEVFEKYNWPGNIRELENVIQRGVQVSKDNIIRPKDLPIYITVEVDNEISQNKKVNLIENQEYKIIIDTLKNTKGNAKLASEILGISRSTIYRKLSKIGFNIDSLRNQ